MHTIFLVVVLVFTIAIVAIRFGTNWIKFKELNSIYVRFNAKRYKVVNIYLTFIPLVACVITGYNFYIYLNIDKTLLFSSSLLYLILSISYVKIIDDSSNPK
jgi:hypothetical protein